VEWLIRDRVLTRVFELRKENEQFLRHRGNGIQGCNEGGKGAKFPRLRVTMGAPNGCGGHQKVPTTSQVPSSTQYICFRKTSVSNTGAPNLLLVPGAIWPRYAPGGIADHFENEFIMSLAYLADIFSHSNDLNISILETAMNISTTRERISAFTNILSIWISHIGSGNCAKFPQLDVFNGKISLPVVIEIKKHLQVLQVTAVVPRLISARRYSCFTELDAKPIYI